MVNTYRCPGCGAPLEFQTGTEELVCEYCGTHKRVSELTQADLYPEDVENLTEEDAPRAEFTGYICQSCGACLITDEHTTATVCCYCGSSALIRERMDGILKPAGVIPFQIDKNQAKEKFRHWICTGLFTPKIFKNTATLEEIKGIYVPFWLYDYDAQAYLEAECTKVKTERKGDMEYRHTDYYHVVRDGAASYLKVPADASEHMPDDVMDALEPYNYAGMKTFEMPYLAGYESEKYNYESGDREVAGRVEARVRSYISKDVRASIHGYSNIRCHATNISLQRKKAIYTLLPVWMITYRYQGENKIFAINGQTGKQVGTLPNSKQKMFAWFGGITAGIAAILFVLGGMFG